MKLSQLLSNCKVVNQNIENNASKFDKYLKLDLKCKKGNSMNFLCQNKKCIKQSSFLCINDQCICHQGHQKCLLVLFKSIIKSFQDKLLKVSDCSNVIEKLFQKSIDKLCDLKDKILKQLNQKQQILVGLSERQLQFFQFLQYKNLQNINGKYTMEVISDEIIKQQLSNKINNILKSFSDKFTKFDKQIQNLANQTQKETYKLLKLFEGKRVTELFESKIIDSDQKNQVLNHFFKKDIKQVKLLYRASQNQFLASKFHQICDNIENTVVIGQTQFGKIIGGFTPLKWNKENNSYVKDPKKQSFIFSLTNNHKLQLKNQENAIYCNSSCGPIFGGGYDLYISNQANSKSNSYANIGDNYIHPNYPYNQATSWQAFSGNANSTYKFKIKQWEVHQIIFQ